MKEKSTMQASIEMLRVFFQCIDNHAVTTRTVKVPGSQLQTNSFYFIKIRNDIGQMILICR